MTYSTNYSVVDVKNELPKVDGQYAALSLGFNEPQERIYLADKNNWYWKSVGDPLIDKDVTHWLRPIPNSIIFTKEELEARDRERDRRVAAEAWDDGAFYGNLYRSDYAAFKGKDISRNNKDLKEAKETYLNSLSGFPKFKKKRNAGSFRCHNGDHN